MLTSFRVKSVLGLMTLVIGLGVGFLVIGVPEAKAAPPSPVVHVVIMDCAENQGSVFVVNEITATEEVGVVATDNCAVALQGCLAKGYQIVPGGGGAIFDSGDNDEHVLYTWFNAGNLLLTDYYG